MASSWTSPGCAASAAAAALLGLLVVASVAGAASAAAVRPQPGRAEEGGQGGPLPLTLLVLRAVGAASAAGPPMVADTVVGLERLEPAGDELDALKSAATDVVASPRASSFRTASEPGAVGDLGDPVYLRAAKRQVRYHQCYFNPISCFG